MYKKTELLAPAGSLEKLKIALHYGADAVYGGPSDFSLRAGSGTLPKEHLAKAIECTHNKNAKFYVTFNSFLRENEILKFTGLIEQTAKLNPDAFIISDPGAVSLAKEAAPEIPIHLSTQANNLNSPSVRFWEAQGISRIIMARELSIDEITTIKKNSNAELECFVHGAMCIAFSGRCMLSQFFTDRDANRGVCSQPCRWAYTLVEEKRPDQYLDVEEDKKGTYFFNSKDLCGIHFIPELIKAGVGSMKIEGRMKTANYLATVISVYRDALDSYYENPENFTVKPVWIEELAKVDTRGFTKGFFAPDGENMHDVNNTSGPTKNRYLGLVKDSLGENWYEVQVKNRIRTGDLIELFGPKISVKKEVVEFMTDCDDVALNVTNSGQTVKIRLKNKAEKLDIIKQGFDS